jgi:hypothetical protein
MHFRIRRIPTRWRRNFVETRMTLAVAQRTGIDYDALKEAAAERAALRLTGRPETSRA